jgi:HlyD family secretion protein
MVKAGQVIMTLQNLELEGQIAALKASISGAATEIEKTNAELGASCLDLDEARQDEQRKKKLLEAGSISQAEYDAVVYNVDKLEQSVKSLGLALASLNDRQNALESQQESMSRQVQEMIITSPIDGQILAMDCKRDQLITAGTVLATVGTAGRLEVFTEILCDDMSNVKVGQEARITFTGSEGLVLAGRVKEIYPQANEKISALGVAQRRVPVIITLDENGPLRPGYEVQVEIITAIRKGVSLLPRETIVVNSEGKEFVRLVVGNRIKTRQIKTGLKNSTMIEIVDGLNKGDIVLRDASSSLKNGSRVKVK